MKVLKSIVLPVLFFVLFSCNKTDMVFDKWSLAYDSGSRGLTLKKNSAVVCDGLYTSYMLNEKKITTKSYSKVRFEEEDAHDKFGKGKTFRLIYEETGLPVLTQSFYFYEGKDYVLTEFSIEGDDAEVSSNYMAPVNIDDFTFLPESAENRALFVPFDNDCWIRYRSHELTFDELTSYEV
ncbi:MAG TPA: alpha-galactosidase, partial [Porphyromonadaceae bacterium]|nr:alpha-galactosidase [Porphyromonadaceae bacterium]